MSVDCALVVPHPCLNTCSAWALCLLTVHCMANSSCSLLEHALQAYKVVGYRGTGTVSAVCSSCCLATETCVVQHPEHESCVLRGQAAIKGTGLLAVQIKKSWLSCR